MKSYVEGIQKKKNKFESEYKYDNNTPFNPQNYKTYMRAITLDDDYKDKQTDDDDLNDKTASEHSRNSIESEESTNSGKSSCSRMNKRSDGRSGSRSDSDSDKRNHFNSSATVENKTRSADIISTQVNTPTVETQDQNPKILSGVSTPPPMDASNMQLTTLPTNLKLREKTEELLSSLDESSLGTDQVG